MHKAVVYGGLEGHIANVHQFILADSHEMDAREEVAVLGGEVLQTDTDLHSSLQEGVDCQLEIDVDDLWTLLGGISWRLDASEFQCNQITLCKVVL